MNFHSDGGRKVGFSSCGGGEDSEHNGIGSVKISIKLTTRDHFSVQNDTI